MIKRENKGLVSPVTWDDMERLGVDENNQLYWDGKKVTTREVISLGNIEIKIAIFVAFLALVSTGTDLWQWLCELHWLTDSMCPLPR